MATAVNDSYSAASGASIYAGGSTQYFPMLTLPASGTIGRVGASTLNSVAATTSQQRLDLTKVLGAWGTSAVVLIKTGSTVTDFLYVIFGGGHGDTSYDGVVAWRASTAAYEVLLAPSSNYVPGVSHDVVDISNGEDDAPRPASQHAYQNMMPLHSDDAQGPAFMQLRGSAVGKLASSSGQGHKFDTTAKTWARWGSNNTSSATSVISAMLKDTSRQLFVRYPSDNYFEFYTADYTLSNPTWSTGTQAARAVGWSDGPGSCGVYDPVRDLDIAGHHYGTAGHRLRAISSAARTGTWTELTFTGTGPTNMQDTGLMYRSANDTFLLPDLSTTVPTGFFVLTPPSSSPLTNAWTWSRMAFTGTSLYTNFAGVWGNTGSYNRFQYVAALDTVMVCPDAGQPMEFWKL